MKDFSKFFTIICLFISSFSFSQQFSENDLKTDFITKSQVLIQKKYLQQRKSMDIPQELKAVLIKLREKYNANIDKAGMKISEKLFSDEDAELFEIMVLGYMMEGYPDISIGLLNRGNYLGKDFLTEEEKTTNNTLLVDIWKKIPNPVYSTASDITDAINKDRFRMTLPYRFDYFRSYFDDAVRKRNDVINFLLWNLE